METSWKGFLWADNRISKEPSTIIARKAYLISNPDTLAITLRLEDGTTHTVDAGLKNYRKMDFHFYDVRLDLTESLSEGKKISTKPTTDMTVTELSAMLKSKEITDGDSSGDGVRAPQEVDDSPDLPSFCPHRSAPRNPRPSLGPVARVCNRCGCRSDFLPVTPER